MYFGTHACLPLVVITTIDIVKNKGSDSELNNTQLFFIGLAGILPDILWPHFSLQARLESWTHTIWFLIAIIPFIFFISKWTMRKNFLRFSIFFWIAIALHILVDTFSGGVSLFYPLGKVIGNYFIPYYTWGYSDLTFIVLLVFLLILRRIRRNLSNKKVSEIH